ncbi:MAG: hypothetical protein LBS32_00675 [Clostridiales Family XIII bacterium]|jgi:LmbE family N-acetylglucosaminyl deacetylase|nr:hypothetical protein [Clostridiales Family XIII bacterium]
MGQENRQDPMHFGKARPGNGRSAVRFAAAFALLSAICLFAALPGARAQDAVPADTRIVDGVTLALPGGLQPQSLLDGSYGTWADLPGGDAIGIASDEAFAFVYLIWDTPPGAWRFLAGGATLEMGQNAYLHELVRLDAPARQAAMLLPAQAGRLCDVYLFRSGELPAWVQQWQPILERADLLALPTHADDEHLFFGGILPTYAGERQLAVQVAYMTNHWGERYRPHELLNGLWTVGVTAYPLIGPFADLYVSKESLSAAERTYGRESVLEFQVELLRRFKPKVVVGHDLAGEYGHGAHRLNAATLVDALALCGDEAAYPDSAGRWGLWETPKAYLHLYAENGIVMDWNLPLERFGGRTAYEMAVEGFACHRSQTEYFSVRQDGTWHDCRKFGLVHTLVGPDAAGGDLFENIDLSPEPEPDPEPPSDPAPPEPVSPLDAARMPEAEAPLQQQAAGGAFGLPPAAVVAGLLALAAALALVAVLSSRALRDRGGARRRT